MKVREDECDLYYISKKKYNAVAPPIALQIGPIKKVTPFALLIFLFNLWCTIDLMIKVAIFFYLLQEREENKNGARYLSLLRYTFSYHTNNDFFSRRESAFSYFLFLF